HLSSMGKNRRAGQVKKLPVRACGVVVERRDMTSSGAASVYRIFKKTDGAAPVRSVVIAMVIVAAALTGLGVVRVKRQHEVLALGYQLDREAEHLRHQKEINRRLQVEYATQSSPE